MELRTQLETIIKKAIGLEDDDIKILLDHILSPRIGVKEISDLEEMAIEHFPSGSSRSRSRSPIAGTPLNTIANEGSMSSSSSAVDNNDDPTQAIPFGEGEFTYIINWNDMPRKSVRALEKAKELNKVGDDEDINLIKLALAAKITKAYQDYRKTNSFVTQKTPGIKVSLHVAAQVVSKFGVAMQEVLNGVVHGNGLHTFKRRLQTKIENDLRHKSDRELSEIPFVSRGVGVAGVLKEQYKPALTIRMKHRQSEIQMSLKITYVEQDPNEWDWLSVRSQMSETYELQREVIVELTTKVLEEATEERENNPDDDLDIRAMCVLKREWPFLFYTVPMNTHFKRLTGLDLQQRIEVFLSRDQLNYILLFFCSCSSSAAINTQNLILKLKVEDRVDSTSMSVGTRFLLGFCMIANSFNETYANTFLLTAERTLKPEEVASVQGLPSSICIVALGSSIFTANKYLISVDKICLAEKTSAMDAILMLFMICFIFDVEYPPGLALTFEFIERIVLEMTLKETRVKNKKGKVLLVLTEKVRKAGKAFQDFVNKVQEGLEGDF